MSRMDRLEDGNLGDWGPVGEGLCELIFDVEGGYRVYFGQDGDFIVLLCVGMKKTQTRDIALARKYWREYNA
jgi:putative addiction module killer protein